LGWIAVIGTFLFLAVLLPAACAQIVPVSLTKATAADSRVPRGSVLAPLPRSEPRRAVKTAAPKSFFVLGAGVYAAAGLDMQQSESMLPHFDEKDPVVQPFWRLPAPAHYASAATPKLCVLPGAPYLCASLSNRSLLPASSTTVFAILFRRSQFPPTRCHVSCPAAQSRHGLTPLLPTIEFA
jgi:hypothetical protein